MSTDFLGKGLRFPFAFQRRSGGAQVSTVTSMDHAHIHESILQILGTRPGERFMSPEFGSRLKDLVFEPNDSVLKGLIRHYVIDAIERWDFLFPRRERVRLSIKCPICESQRSSRRLLRERKDHQSAVRSRCLEYPPVLCCGICVRGDMGPLRRLPCSLLRQHLAQVGVC